ncbi:MAG TPA: cupin domain-containing protein [Gaiellaceae bacterium]|nr:cupin domain-containing protein [Gaiellaceae bacterium]
MHTVFDATGIETRRKAVRRELGITAFGANQFDNQPGQAGSEHDEESTGQQELYAVLGGSGVLRVDGEEVALRPGIYVHVSPDATRQVVAGAEGLSYLVIGAAPGGYELREPF